MSYCTASPSGQKNVQCGGMFRSNCSMGLETHNGILAWGFKAMGSTTTTAICNNGVILRRLWSETNICIHHHRNKSQAKHMNRNFLGFKLCPGFFFNIMYQTWECYIHKFKVPKNNWTKPWNKHRRSISINSNLLSQKVWSLSSPMRNFNPLLFKEPQELHY